MYGHRRPVDSEEEGPPRVPFEGLTILEDVTDWQFSALQISDITPCFYESDFMRACCQGCIVKDVTEKAEIAWMVLVWLLLTRLTTPAEVQKL